LLVSLEEWNVMGWRGNKEGEGRRERESRGGGLMVDAVFGKVSKVGVMGQLIGSREREGGRGEQGARMRWPDGEEGFQVRFGGSFWLVQANVSLADARELLTLGE
jgi:hypothetical protein